MVSREGEEAVERKGILRLVAGVVPLACMMLFPFVDSSISLLLIVLFFASFAAVARCRIRNIAFGLLIGAVVLCACVSYVSIMRVHRCTEGLASVCCDTQHQEIASLFHTTPSSSAVDFYIAHGGGVGRYEYANTEEAVADSLKRGFRFIELDLLETTDGHIVAAHDWHLLRCMLKGGDDNSHEPMSLAELRGRTMADGQHLLTETEIRRLMEENKDMILVTDKITNHDLLIKLIPFPERMITEVFSPEGYLSARKAGLLYPAYSSANPRDLSIAVAAGFPMLTMSDARFFSNVFSLLSLRRLHKQGITILVYSEAGNLNDEKFLEHHLGKYLSKIYTGKWSPLPPHGTTE